jgi:hypothetical protein
MTHASTVNGGRWRLFGDNSRYLDRFGLLLVLTTISVSVLVLVDLDDPNESVRSELGWLAVSFSVAFSFLVALRASGVTSRWIRIANVLIGFTLGASVLSVVLHQWTDLASSPAIGRPSLIWVGIAIVSPVVVLRRVLSHRVVTIETLWGALSVYLLIAIAFNYIFLDVQRFGTTAFFGVQESTSSFMYFSLVTITTLGYGDLAPATNIGRFFATSEAIIGQVFLVTIVARLVTLLSRPSFRSDS